MVKNDEFKKFAIKTEPNTLTLVEEIDTEAIYGNFKLYVTGPFIVDECCLLSQSKESIIIMSSSKSVTYPSLEQQSSLSQLNVPGCPFESTTEDPSKAHDNHSHCSIQVNSSRLVVVVV